MESSRASRAPLRLHGGEGAVVQLLARVGSVCVGRLARAATAAVGRPVGHVGVRARRDASVGKARGRARLRIVGEAAHVLEVLALLLVARFALARALLSLRLEPLALAQLHFAPRPRLGREAVVREDGPIVEVREGAAPRDGRTAVLLDALDERVAVQLENGELRQCLEHAERGRVVDAVVREVKDRKLRRVQQTAQVVRAAQLVVRELQRLQRGQMVQVVNPLDEVV